jgi:hypothetical protein
MAQRLSEIIKDSLSRKNPDGSRQWTQMTLAAKLGTNQSGISQMLTGRQWDDHFEVFRKLVVDVEPQALFGEPLDALLRRLSPQGLARLKREVEAMVRQLSLRAVEKNIKRLFWMSGMLYMLDGICCAIKM